MAAHGGHHCFESTICLVSGCHSSVVGKLLEYGTGMVSISLTHRPQGVNSDMVGGLVPEKGGKVRFARNRSKVGVRSKELSSCMIRKISRLRHRCREAGGRQADGQQTCKLRPNLSVQSVGNIVQETIAACWRHDGEPKIFV